MPRLLVFLGLAIAAVGVLWWLFPNALSWFGRLPGDIRIERENGVFLFPITSMIIVSIVFSVILTLWFRR